MTMMIVLLQSSRSEARRVGGEKRKKKKKRGVLNAQNKLIEDLPFLTFLMIIFICRVEQ